MARKNFGIQEKIMMDISEQDLRKTQSIREFSAEKLPIKREIIHVFVPLPLVNFESLI